MIKTSITMIIFHVQLQMLDGSVATIIYAIDGSRKMSKEYIEVSGEDSSVIIDDFSNCTVFKNGKKIKLLKTVQIKVTNHRYQLL